MGSREKYGYSCQSCIYTSCHQERWLLVSYLDKGIDVQCPCMLMRHYACGRFHLQGGPSDVKGISVNEIPRGEDFAIACGSCCSLMEQQVPPG